MADFIVAQDKTVINRKAKGLPWHIYELHFVDSNGNGLLDAGEEYSAEPTAYFVGGEQVSAEEFASYQISGEYQYLMGEKTAAELETELS